LEDSVELVELHFRNGTASLLRLFEVDLVSASAANSVHKYVEDESAESAFGR